MSHSLTLTSIDQEIQLNDIVGRLNFAAPGESSGSIATRIAGSVKAIAEGDFTDGDNSTSIVFATASNGDATDKLKINSDGHLLPVADSSYDLGSDSFYFRSIYADKYYGDIDGPIVVECRNDTGSTISKGSPVYISGYYSNNGKPQIAVSNAASASTMPAIGILANELTNGSEGHVHCFGLVTQINTASFSVGDTVYVASGGGLTNSRPTGATDLVQNIGRVLRSDASQGRILVLGPGRTNDIPNSLDVTSISTGSLTINNAFTLPTSDGSANQVLQTDGTGNITWANVSGASDNTYVSSASFDANDGELTLTLNDSSTVSVDLDGRYLTSHPSIEAASSSDNSGRTYIQDIILDSNGHVTAVTSATETVVNTDTNYYLDGIIKNGDTLTFSVNGTTDQAYTFGSNAFTSYTDHSTQGYIADADFTSSGLMKRSSLGVYTSIADNSTNWNAAYGWGDHSSEGYLKNITSESLGQLSDVSVNTPSPNQVLAYSSGDWINKTFDISLIQKGSVPLGGYSSGQMGYYYSWNVGTEAVVNEQGNAINFRVEGDADQYLLYVRGVDGVDKVGVGTASLSGKLNASQTTTDDASQPRTLDVRSNDYTTTNGQYYAFGEVSTSKKYVDSGVTDTGYIIGKDILAFLSDEGSLGSAMGIRTYAGLNNESDNGNLTVAYGIQSRVINNSNTSGSINTARGVDVYINGDLRGVGNGGIVNAYGVYIGAIANSTNKYGVYQVGSSDKNYFAGDVGIATANPNYKLDVNGTFSANSINVNDEYTFPTVDGTANQILKTDGNGNLSWVDNFGAGAVLSVKSTGTQIGGSDIEVLDFSNDFEITETPDKEINISLKNNYINGSFDITSTTSSFTVTEGYTVGTLNVYHNGIKLYDGEDFTATNGTSFTLTNAAISGDVVEYWGLNSATSATGDTTFGSITASSGQTSFSTTGYTNGGLVVFVNGVKMVNGSDFTATNGSSFTLSSAASAGDIVDYIAYGAVVASTNLQKTGDTMTGNLTVNADLIVTGYKETHVDNGNTGTSQTITITNSTLQTYTLTGNCVFTMPSNDAGRSFTIFLKTGSGSFTATFTGAKFPQNTSPTITTDANRMDIVTFYSDGTNWYGSIQQEYHV